MGTLYLVQVSKEIDGDVFLESSIENLLNENICNMFSFHSLEMAFGTARV